MANAASGNAYVRALLEAARMLLNSPRSLRLFGNDFEPTSATSAAEFVEAWFPGYLRKSTAGIFGNAYKVIDGLYQSDSSLQTWTPSADSPVLVYGWYILDPDQLLLAARLANPITVVSGTPIQITIQLQEASLSRC